MEIATAEVEIRNQMGIHLRPASSLVQVCNQYPACEVEFSKTGLVVNGKSIMSVIMLAAEKGSTIGIKVMGPDLAVLSDLASEISTVIKTDQRTGPHTTSAFAEKPLGGSYLDLQIDRAAIARYGLSVADVQDTISTALGGLPVTTTVEGRERYSVNIRYPTELRDSLDHIRQTLVATPGKAQIPLGQLATMEIKGGPDMIRSENARPSHWVYVDVSGIDLGTYVHDAQRVVETKVKLPPGYSLVWSGQYEYIQEANQRLMVLLQDSRHIFVKHQRRHATRVVGDAGIRDPDSIIGNLKIGEDRLARHAHDGY